MMGDIPHHEFLVGRCLNNRFDVQSLLGQGEFSVVYLAQDRKRHKKVAVKTPRDRSESEESFEAEQLFLQACSTTAQQHPWSLATSVGVLLATSFEKFDHASHTILGAAANASPPTRVFFVFNVLSSDLQRVVQQRGGGAMPLDFIHQVAEDILRGLKFLHEGCGIIHMDIKPANIGVTTDDDRNGGTRASFCLLDLGNATWVDPNDQTPVEQTMPYRSPEVVAMAPKISPAADMWSLGVVLWELALGEAFYRIGQGEADKDGENMQRVKQLCGYARKLQESIPAGVVADGLNRLGGPDLSELPNGNAEGRFNHIMKELSSARHGLEKNLEDLSSLARLLSKSLALHPGERPSSNVLLHDFYDDDEMAAALPVPSDSNQRRTRRGTFDFEDGGDFAALAHVQANTEAQPTGQTQQVGTPPRSGVSTKKNNTIKKTLGLLFNMDDSIVYRIYFLAWKEMRTKHGKKKEEWHAAPKMLPKKTYAPVTMGTPPRSGAGKKSTLMKSTVAMLFGTNPLILKGSCFSAWREMVAQRKKGESDADGTDKTAEARGSNVAASNESHKNGKGGKASTPPRLTGATTNGKGAKARTPPRPTEGLLSGKGAKSSTPPRREAPAETKGKGKHSTGSTPPRTGSTHNSTKGKGSQPDTETNSSGPDPPVRRGTFDMTAGGGKGKTAKGQTDEQLEKPNDTGTPPRNKSSRKQQLMSSVVSMLWCEGENSIKEKFFVAWKGHVSSIPKSRRKNRRSEWAPIPKQAVTKKTVNVGTPPRKDNVQAQANKKKAVLMMFNPKVMVMAYFHAWKECLPEKTAASEGLLESAEAPGGLLENAEASEGLQENAEASDVDDDDSDDETF